MSGWSTGWRTRPGPRWPGGWAWSGRRRTGGATPTGTPPDHNAAGGRPSPRPPHHAGGNVVENDRELPTGGRTARRPGAGSGRRPARADCPDLTDLMDLALGRAADPARLERHAAACGPCAARLEAYRR